MEQPIDQWKSAITAGNDCFNAQRNGEAIRHYENAKAVACALYPQSRDAEEAIAAVVVSYHNLADLYLRENLPELAEIELQKSHTYVLNALRDHEEQSPRRLCPKCYESRADALLKAASRTYLALIRHRGTHSGNTQQAEPVRPPLLTH
ncbi:hypothetical protein [Pontibacterium sp.]|uniref:hypothetical protein n=1 Tax=Pontibacterium sp. TaxID=2036026 RepID=UPI003518D2AC